MLKGLLILIGFQLAGEFAVTLLGLPFPGSVVGMGLLFIFLLLNRRTPEPLLTTSTALFPYIPLFLMPACVGAMGYWALIQEQWIALTVALTLSTVAVIIAIPSIMRGTTALFRFSNENTENSSRNSFRNSDD